MTRRVLPVLCIALLLAWAPFAEAGRRGEDGAPGDRNPLNDRLTPEPNPIENHVLDLLDEEFTMVSEVGQDLWESASFPTRRFNRIGLRFSADATVPLTCWVAWQYDRDDEFLDGVPIVTRRYALTNPDGPGNGSGGTVPYVPGHRQRSDGLPDLQRPRQIYPIGSYPPSIDFTEVRGLGARVRCAIPQFQVIGDDPDDPSGGTPISASLTDVKVLLRRE